MAGRQRSLDRGPAERVVPRPARGGAGCHGEVIASDPAGTPLGLSSRCPHLGCRVDRVQDGELVCPCHGSRFALDGALRQGPAAEGLQRLSCAPTPDGARLTIRLPG